MVKPPPEVAALYASRSDLVPHWKCSDAASELFVPTLLPGALGLPLGSPVRLSVRFSDDPKHSFRVLGRVAWIRPRSQGELTAGVAVSFVPNDFGSRDLLWAYVCGRKIPFTPRESVRHPAALKISCSSGSEVLDRTTEDISQGGAFIVSERMPKVGSLVTLKLRPPRALFAMRLDGRVTWHRNRSGERGFGVRFVYRDERQVASVKKLVERASRASLRG